MCDASCSICRDAAKRKTNHANTGIGIGFGQNESLPVAGRSVDVILSNCVVNLSPDKARVYREAFRVLKPGGRLVISDIVALAPVPESIRKDMEVYTACGGGAAQVEDVKAMLQAAGFRGTTSARARKRPRCRSRCPPNHRRMTPTWRN
jgi:SAM-dependent methyltransferase